MFSAMIMSKKITFPQQIDHFLTDRKNEVHLWYISKKMLKYGLGQENDRDLVQNFHIFETKKVEILCFFFPKSISSREKFLLVTYFWIHGTITQWKTVHIENLIRLDMFCLIRNMYFLGANLHGRIGSNSDAYVRVSARATPSAQPKWGNESLWNPKICSQQWLCQKRSLSRNK